ncbi:MAG: alpha/beta hydrolase-fold protein [Archangium sp.]|nr:alpha/beta hydrolase-fold protein [Archangium sp.]
MHSLFLVAGLLAAAPTSQPLVVGTSHVFSSEVLHETRQLNVYLPADYAEGMKRYPVLYLIDGGFDQDLLHILGLLQIGMANGTMVPTILVGVQSTERKRDLTGPTESADDKKIAPQVGGSAAYRTFLATEVMPFIAKTYREDGKRGIIGESLAGLFVLETFFVQPSLFDTYLAISPSLWWNNQALVKSAAAKLKEQDATERRLYVAVEEESLGHGVKALKASLKKAAPKTLHWQVDAFAGETHGTVFHPAALKGLRWAY